METAIQSMGLRDVAPFDPEEKVLGHAHGGRALWSERPPSISWTRSPGTPPPREEAPFRPWREPWALPWRPWWPTSPSGKGSSTTGTRSFADLADEAQKIKDALVRGVDEDTEAFDEVIAGMRMPKDTPEERAVRAMAIQEGYKAATLVPLATVERCRDALRLCLEMVRMAPEEMMSDVGTGALVARAGLIGAAYNVRINLKSIGDEAFSEEMLARLSGLVAEGESLARQVEELMEKALG